MIIDKYLLKEAQCAWEASAPLRAVRRRLKGFAYGRQWGDTILTPDGRKVSEEERAREEGRTPVTNNIIRRMVKSIIGHYRHLAVSETADNVSNNEEEGRTTFTPFCERDARALEELLISGCTIQRIDKNGAVENVSPERFIFRRFANTDGSDCRFLGMLRDIPLAEVLSKYSGHSPSRATEIKEAYRGRNITECSLSFLSSAVASDFITPALPGCVRIIEIWEHSSAEVLRVHDPETADYRLAAVGEYDELRRQNTKRRRKGRKPMSISYDMVHGWMCTIMTPAGEVLYTEEAGRHPFVMRFYPMIDGEVHSAVEDVVDQQKLVNRLVSTLDQIIASTAKGVLLYPADQLPDGFTWKDVRRIWSNPSGILPFKRTSKTLMPHQVSAAGNSSGANDLLRTQLELFDEISGATGAFRGKSSTAAGEGMLRAEMENSLISMLDILNSFHEFMTMRDKLLQEQMKKVDESDRNHNTEPITD